MGYGLGAGVWGIYRYWGRDWVRNVNLGFADFMGLGCEDRMNGGDVAQGCGAMMWGWDVGHLCSRDLGLGCGAEM